MSSSKEYDYDKEFEDNTHESSSKSDTDETSHEAESLDSSKDGLLKPISRWKSFQIWPSSKDK